MYLKSGNIILHNRFFLYFILFVSIFNLIGFTTNGNLLFPVIFILIGFMTSYFSKNMLVILMISLLITNIFNFGLSNTLNGSVEGMAMQQTWRTEIKDLQIIINQKCQGTCATSDYCIKTKTKLDDTKKKLAGWTSWTKSNG